MNTRRFMLHSVVLAIFTVFSAQSLFSKTVPFSHQPLLAGKASLTDNGFEVKRTLGTVAFAPELTMPIELVYSSSSENSGVFGYGWNSPTISGSYNLHYRDDFSEPTGIPYIEWGTPYAYYDSWLNNPIYLTGRIPE